MPSLRTAAIAGGTAADAVPRFRAPLARSWLVCSCRITAGSRAKFSIPATLIAPMRHRVYVLVCGHHLQVIPPLGEREEGTFLNVRCQEPPPDPLIELWLGAGSL